MGLKYGERPKLPIEIRTSWGSDDDGNRYARVSIEDRASHMMLLEFNLDGPQLANFLGSSSTHVTAELTAHLERVGKCMEFESTTVPSSVFKDQKDADRAAEAWRIANGWDVAEVRRNNASKWVMSGRRWVDPSTKES